MVNKESNWIFLSYPLHSKVISYGGDKGFSQQKLTSMDQGDSCNTSYWSLSNHVGTHIDFPRHFSRTGHTLSEYSSLFFVFESIFLAEISTAAPETIIGPGELCIKKAPQETTLLLIKTGFAQFREDPVYWRQNPGLHPELAGYLRTELPNLRVVGFDSISLSSFAHRDLGRKAHKAFLDYDRPILPLEDMDLTQVDENTKIDMVIVSPLRVLETDGSPCTVIAKIERKAEKN